MERLAVKLLLDTHIWYWSLEDPSRLSRRVASAIRRSAGQVWVSPLSGWELQALARKGRLRLKPDAASFVADAWKLGAFHEAAVTNEVVTATEQIWLPHNDPVDSFLAATARAYGFTLATADTDMQKGKGFEILA